MAPYFSSVEKEKRQMEDVWKTGSGKEGRLVNCLWRCKQACDNCSGLGKKDDAGKRIKPQEGTVDLAGNKLAALYILEEGG